MDAYSADAALKRLRDLLTVRVDVVGEKEVELPHRNVDVVWDRVISNKRLAGLTDCLKAERQHSQATLMT